MVPVYCSGNSSCASLLPFRHISTFRYSISDLALESSRFICHKLVYFLGDTNYRRWSPILSTYEDNTHRCSTILDPVHCIPCYRQFPSYPYSAIHYHHRPALPTTWRFVAFATRQSTPHAMFRSHIRQVLSSLVRIMNVLCLRGASFWYIVYDPIIVQRKVSIGDGTLGTLLITTYCYNLHNVLIVSTYYSTCLLLRVLLRANNESDFLLLTAPK